MQCVPTSGFWRGVSRRTCSTARTLTQNCSQGIWEIRQHAQTRCHKAACRSEPQPGTNHPAVCRQSWVHGPGLAKMFHGAAAARPSTRDSHQVPMVALASSHAAPHCSDPEGWQTYTGWGQAPQAQQPWFAPASVPLRQGRDASSSLTHGEGQKQLRYSYTAAPVHAGGHREAQQGSAGAPREAGRCWGA